MPILTVMISLISSWIARGRGLDTHDIFDMSTIFDHPIPMFIYGFAIVLPVLIFLPPQTPSRSFWTTVFVALHLLLPISYSQEFNRYPDRSDRLLIMGCLSIQLGALASHSDHVIHYLCWIFVVLETVANSLAFPVDTVTHIDVVLRLAAAIILIPLKLSQGWLHRDAIMGPNVSTHHQEKIKEGESSGALRWKPNMEHFWLIIWPTRRPALQICIVLSIALAFVEEYLDFLVTQQTGNLVSTLSSHDPITGHFYYYAGFNIAWRLVAHFRHILWEIARFNREQGDDIYQRLMELDFSVFAQVPADEILRAVRNADYGNNLMQSLFITVPRTLYGLYLSGIGLLNTSPVVRNVTISAAVIGVINTIARESPQRKAFASWYSSYLSKDQRFDDDIRGHMTIVNYNQIKPRSLGYRAIAEKWKARSTEQLVVIEKYSLFSMTTWIGGLLLAQHLVFQDVSVNEVSVGTAMVLHDHWLTIEQRFDALVGVIKSFREELDKIGRLREILERKKVENGKQHLVVTEGKVEFVGVTFAFPGMGGSVLEDCNLEFPGGQMTTIVGESGVGKSTMLHLIHRNYLPVDGKIRIDGQDVGDLAEETLRSRVSFLSQKSHLFTASLIDNIRIGKPDASEEEVHDACRKACIHETIMGRPGQYGSVVQGGSGLSGGEKQRVILARLFLQKPDILLLDEVTSALDAETDNRVMTNIQQEFKGKTIINVSHRLATARKSDNIVFVSNAGKVCESGTHDALLRRGGVYASLWEEYQKKQ